MLIFLVSQHFWSIFFSSAVSTDMKTGHELMREGGKEQEEVEVEGGGGR